MTSLIASGCLSDGYLYFTNSRGIASELVPHLIQRETPLDPRTQPADVGLIGASKGSAQWGVLSAETDAVLATADLGPTFV